MCYLWKLPIYILNHAVCQWLAQTCECISRIWGPVFRITPFIFTVLCLQGNRVGSRKLIGQITTTLRITSKTADYLTYSVLTSS